MERRAGAEIVQRGACLALVVGALAAPAFAAAESVDLELVIATDVSRSIDHQEALLQREGVAAAGGHPRHRVGNPGQDRRRLYRLFEPRL